MTMPRRAKSVTSRSLTPHQRAITVALTMFVGRFSIGSPHQKKLRSRTRIARAFPPAGGCQGEPLGCRGTVDTRRPPAALLDDQHVAAQSLSDLLHQPVARFAVLLDF